MSIKNWLRSRSVPKAPDLEGEFVPQFQRFRLGARVERAVTVTRKTPDGVEDQVNVMRLTRAQMRAIKKDPKVAWAIPDVTNRKGEHKVIRPGDSRHEPRTTPDAGERNVGEAVSALLERKRGHGQDLDRARRILDEADVAPELTSRILEAIAEHGLSRNVESGLEALARDMPSSYRPTDDPGRGDAAAPRELAPDPSERPSRGDASEPRRPEKRAVDPTYPAQPAAHRGAVERVDSPDDEPGGTAPEPPSPTADRRVELPGFEPPPDPAAEPADWHVEPRDIEPPDIEPPDIELADNDF